MTRKLQLAKKIVLDRYLKTLRVTAPTESEIGEKYATKANISKGFEDIGSLSAAEL